ncbi:MAG: ATP-binding cassette domain-containing protein [Burkholderiales bacterium]|nr:ATP-binding cassette domain-containing protein [Burkholderiales bacterium]
MAHDLGLCLRGVGYRYGPVEVLAGLDLTLARGEALAVVGPSGCGKTTLLNLIAGLTRPTAGEIACTYTRPAYVFQQPRLLPWKRARDNIALGLKAAGLGRRARAQAAEALGLKLGLTAADLDKYPHQLSGGMQSRVALARALVLSPDLLLLDEPFAALDVGLKAELHALLLAELARREAGLVLVTHDLMEAVRLADRIVLMQGPPGRLVAQYPLAHPRTARDDAWVYRTGAQFMQERAVRAGFGLPPASTASPAAADAVLTLPRRDEALAAPRRRRHCGG